MKASGTGVAYAILIGAYARPWGSKAQVRR